MEFRILGPLEVVEEGQALPLGGPKQRALLAVLVLNANQVVSTDRLIDALWGEEAPEGTSHTLQVYVSQLRKALRTPTSPSQESLLVTRGGGYVLLVAPGEVDLDRFEQITGEGTRALESGAFDEAAYKLREALDLWRGPVLAEFAFETFARPEIARIEDMRLSVIEDRVEADLALGRHGELVGELRALVAEHPLRERLRAQLMLALYRAGRQAEALQVYREGRQMLADELGIDPSPDLQRLERAILQQDSELTLKRPHVVPVDSTSVVPSVDATAWRSRWLAAVAGLVILGAAALVIVLFATSSSGPQPPGSVPGDSVARIDLENNEIVSAIPTTGNAPTAIAWFDSSVWVANTVSRTVSRIDPDSNLVVRTIPTDGAPTDIAGGDGAVWVLNGLDGTVLAIDPRTDDVSMTVDVPAGSGGIAVGADAVWVTNTLEGTVTRIDPHSGVVTGTIDLGKEGAVAPGPIAIRAGTVWVGDGLSASLWKIDVETDLVVASPGLRGVPTEIAIDQSGVVWVSIFEEDLLSFIDPISLRVNTITAGRDPRGIAVGDDSVWVANSLDGTVSRFDSGTESVVETILIGGTPEGVTVGGGSVWVSVQP